MASSHQRFAARECAAFVLQSLLALGVRHCHRIATGPGRALALYLFLAAGSGAAEYAVSNGGVGLSGVVYGMFGLLWVFGRYDYRDVEILDRSTINLFVTWFFVCIGLTVANVMPIGNTAHGSGAVLGALAGFLLAREGHYRMPAGIALTAVLALIAWGATIGRPLINFSKYGSSEVATLGYEALLRNDDAAALKYLQEAVKYRTVDAQTWRNLGIAYERLNRVEESREAYRHAAKLDHAGDDIDNRFANPH